MELSQRRNIFSTWLAWQFYEAPKFLLMVWKNYLAYAENYFSVLFLLKNFFAPWRRYNWAYPKGFQIYEFFLALTSNIFSRFLGACMRVVLILAGLIFYVLVFFAGLIIFLLWIAIPFLIIFGFLLLFTL